MARRRANARQARRLVVEQPAVYYADTGRNCAATSGRRASAEDVERLTGLRLERRSEGVALINAGQRLTDVMFPSTGTVAQAALLLCARIAGYLQHNRSRVELLPAATAAERLAEAAAGIDAALPDRGRAADVLAGLAGHPGTGAAAGGPPAEMRTTARPRPPTHFCPMRWLRTELRKLVDDFGAGMAEKQAADPQRPASGRGRAAQLDDWWRGWRQGCWCCRYWPATAASPPTSRLRPAGPEPGGTARAPAH